MQSSLSTSVSMIPERFCFLLLLAIIVLQSCKFQLAMASSHSSNFSDQSALLSFQTNNTVLGGNWTEATSFCNWVGVSCGRNRQRVTSLNLSYMGLQGTISPLIGNLSFLFSLDLRNNSFYGNLPNEISRLHRLKELLLQFNQLEGNIPPTLHHCRELQLLSLEANRLSGAIPEELGFLPSLRVLNLHRNNLNGAIPSSLGNISTLQILNLRETGLTGSLPSSLFNLSSVTVIDLIKNNISGTLPMDICHYWPNIQSLNLCFNKLSGQLPSEIHQCKDLVELFLGYNMFEGGIPAEIGNLHKLELLDLGGNSLIGTIPPTVGNLSRLRKFYMMENSIQGNIPTVIGLLSNLIVLNMERNSLTGEVPDIIFNMSSLQIIDLGRNSLSGHLPLGGYRLHNLEMLFLPANQLEGYIPSYFSNSSKLIHLDFCHNLLTGPIPATSLGKLNHLRYLALQGNRLTGELGNPELNFLTALSNCSSLETLVLQSNPLNGYIPDSIGNFSSSFQIFFAPDCQIKGHIPSSIGSLKSLTFIELSSNNLTGTIPSTVGGLQRLQRFHADDNKIAGFIPKELCSLQQLGEISFRNNEITGPIPDCISNLTRLQTLLLSANRLNSSIPVTLWDLEHLLFLNLSSNFLSGSLLASLRKSGVMENLDLSRNQISGNIPSVLSAFESLISLNLSKNKFEGSIPESFGDLRALDDFDLSYNDLSGTVAKSLEKLPFLKHLNLSFNKLTGEIPTGGPFANLTAESFLENTALCGEVVGVPPCASSRAKKSRPKEIILKYILPGTGLVAIIVFAVTYMLLKNQERASQTPSCADDLLPRVQCRMITYQELCQATYNFSESNFLGKGSFGSVYKGVLSDGTTVAVKILNLELVDAFKSFDAECMVLRTMRHRNLVKIISSCSNPELRALILQYMPNGNLESWLYLQNYKLDIIQRVSIMVDVASALEYLHHGQSEPVVHCDLKPSNILLDEDMVAHVSDFGISKILSENKNATHTRTLGTLGYIAPEYGSEGIVSTKGDVYSYGIMLVEIFTAKKPTDEMFDKEMSLRKWVAKSIPDKMEMMHIIDGALLDSEEGDYLKATHTILLSVIELGLECTKELPGDRIDMKEVVVKLNKIKLAFLLNRNNDADNI